MIPKQTPFEGWGNYARMGTFFSLSHYVETINIGQALGRVTPGILLLVGAPSQFT